jgi:hypothetical protein
MISFRMADRRRRRLNSSYSSTSSCWLRICFVTMILFAAWGAVRAQSQEPETQQTDTVHGTVVNAVTRAPVARALVYSPDNRYATLTDGEGHFEFTVPRSSGMPEGMIFSGPPRQTWSYSGRHHGLQLMARKPGFLADSTEQSPIFISSSDDDLTISLLPEGIIKGRVTITGGEPAGGAAVQLFSQQVQDGLPRWVPGASEQTNSAGDFRIAELQPGTYKVVTKEWMDNDPAANLPGTQLYGFPPVYFPGVADFSAAGPIELGPGQTIQADIPIAGQPYFHVRIPVANGNANLRFKVSVEGPQGARFELGYNMQEQRVEGTLPSGSYVVRVSSFGLDSVSGTARIRVAGAPLEAPVMMLTANSPIPINVKEEFTDTRWVGSGTIGGISVHGPRLYLQASLESADEVEQRGGSIRPPRAPNDDELALESVSPGRYWLHLSTSRGYVASATSGSTDLLRQPFVIASGASAPIEVTLRDDGAELDGTVASPSEHNATGDLSVRSAWVYCVPLPESSGQFQEIAISDEGKFVIPMMAPGDYRILVFNRPQSRLPYRDAEAMKPYASQGLLVHLAAGQKMTVQVPMISPTE